MAASAAAAAGANVTASTTAALKYAALGIDMAQQDVFETPDAPPRTADDDDAVDGADASMLEDESPDINNAALGSAQLVRKRFAESKLDLSRADRSDALKSRRGARRRVPRVAPLTGVTMYAAESSSESGDERGGTRRRGTPLQRYLRLESALAELADEVAARADADATSQADPGAIDQKVTARALHENVLALQRHLAELQMSSPTARAMLDKGEAASAALVAETGLSERLIAQVRAQKDSLTAPTTTTAAATAPSGAATAGAAAAGGSGADGAGGSLAFSVFVRPETGRFEASAKVADVERRLASLEQLVGHPTPDAAVRADLQSAVASLDARLTLLDEEKLRGLQRRLAAVSQTMGELLERKAALTDGAASDATANQLLAKMTRWDALVAELPDLVERLQALARLHTEADNFAVALERVESTQSELGASLAAQSALLRKVEMSLAENMAVVQGNVEALDKRMAALKK